MLPGRGRDYRTWYVKEVAANTSLQRTPTKSLLVLVKGLGNKDNKLSSRAGWMSESRIREAY